MMQIRTIAATVAQTIVFPQGTLGLGTGDTFWRAWDVAVRLLFAAYYIPFILVCLGGLLDAVLHLSFTVLLPAVHSEAPALAELSTAKAVSYWFSLLKFLLPYVTSIVGVLTVGHKMLKCIGEAMVDSYFVFNGMNYSLTLAMLTFALESHRRVAIFLSVSGTLCTLFVIVFLTDAVLLWSTREEDVQWGTWIIIVTQCLGVMFGLVYASLNETFMPRAFGLERARTFAIAWWRDNIGRIRYSAVHMLLVFQIWILFTRGPIRALNFFVETLIYLNVPNVVGFTCLAATVSAVRSTHTLRWLWRHGEYVLPSLTLFAPYGLCWAYTVAFFEASLGIVVLMIFVTVALFVRCVDLCRQDEVGPSGSVAWTTLPKKREGGAPVNVAPHLAAELEDAFQRGVRRPALVSLDFKYSVDSMTLKSRADNSVVQLRRTLRGDSAITIRGVVLRLLPRVLLLESRNAFTGSRFNRTRIVLKILVLVCVTVLTVVVGGAIVQETVLPLQPIAVAAERTTLIDSREEQLTLHHLVVDLHLRYGKSRAAPTESNRNDAHGDVDGLGVICTRQHKRVNLFEFALLSAVPYVDSKQSVQILVEGLNDALGTDWEVRYPRSSDPGPRRAPGQPWHSLVELHSQSRNVTVVSVRGTDFTSFFDMLQDVRLYLEAFLYQLMTHLVPASSLVPSALVADAIDFAAAVEAYTVPWSRPRQTGDVYSRHYHETVIAHMRAKVTSASNGHSFVLVGHSLGGAIAHIAGARLGIKSFGFHSPGIVLPRKKLGVTMSMINRVATTVVASHDVVPYIGWQAGEILHVECTDKVRERCHAVESTIQALWHGCQSIRAAFPNLRSVEVV